MVNLTISISPELLSRLDRYPELNKSEMFRNCAEKRLRLLESLETKEIRIPANILEKIKENIEDISFRFGESSALDSIIEGLDPKVILSISRIPIDVQSFESLKNIIGEILVIEDFEKTFESIQGVPIDKEEFAKGFVLKMRMVINALKY